MSDDHGTYRVLSSGRVLGSNVSVNRVLKSGRCLTNNGTLTKRQRTDDSPPRVTSTIASRIQVSERKPRENEPTKKLLFQAVSDANKSVLMKLNKANGIVKVMNPNGTSECLTTRTLAKRLKSKEPTWIDPSSLVEKAESSLGHMKIRVKNEYCADNDDQKSTDHGASSMEFNDDDDEDDEFVVVVNNDYEAADESNNIWMLNDYPNDDDDHHHSTTFDENKGTGSFKRKLSDDVKSEDNDTQQAQYSPPTNPSATQGKKVKRCRFWPDCHIGDQCEFVHPTQRCIHFPNCLYGVECLYIHPNCRFAGACTRLDCSYFHPSTGNGNQPTGTTRPDNSALCKFGNQCMRPNCAYTHPRVPIVPARNLKWVNSKWRASDDMPILPPAPKNVIYENPFKTVKIENSKKKEINN